MVNSPQIGFPLLAVGGQASAEAYVNAMATILEAFASRTVKSRTTNAQPTTPADGDAYLIGSSPTGTQWGVGTPALAGRWTVAVSGYWYIVAANLEGWEVYVQNENLRLTFDGTSWVEILPESWANALTADATPVQGDVPLTKRNNRFTTVATNNDCCTLPAASEGLVCWIWNDGAATLQVFPASGDTIDGAAANASTTITTGKRRVFKARDSTNWHSVLSG